MKPPVIVIGAMVLCLSAASYGQTPPAPAAAKNLVPARAAAPQPAEGKAPIPHPAWKHELAITASNDGQWGCDPENCRQVMLSAAGTMWKYFPDRKMPRIEAVSKGGPIFIYAIGHDAHVKVCLAVGGPFWAQMAYQFAHEYCHLLCGPGGPTPQMWFQETLCETASRFALMQMSRTWKTHPPYSNWASYSGALRSYFDDLQKNDRLPKGKTLAQWYQENAQALTANSCDRPKNNVVAAEVWAMFDAQPEHWEAVTYFPHEKLDPDTLAEFLRVWRRNCPARHKPFIAALASKFGIVLSGEIKPPDTVLRP